jgi:ornithine cyclodeaminase/alanine dehydrogenase-like protein (mu-crystallin family)
MGAILPAVAMVLREADVKRVVEMDAVIAAVESAMRDLGNGKAQNEPRRRAFPPGGLLNVMFASYPAAGITGLKTYTVGGGRARFLVIVYALDGSLQALIEADLMGMYRTGAATAVAVKALASRREAVVALIGTGPQAATQALAVSRVIKIDDLRVFSRDPERRAAFALEQADRLGIRTTTARSAEAAVRGADVVITMTNSSVPVIEASWVEDHALVVAAGSNFPNRAEIPAELVARARTVVVDQLPAATLESGDLIQAHAAGKFEWERAIELGMVLAGKWQAPGSPGITLFESHGLALWDLAAASVVLPAARERRLGEEIELF